MSTVRTTFPENRFAKLARQPGGLSLTEALSRAQANLDSIRDESAAYVDARLGEIDAALGGDGSRVEDEALRRAYGLANDVVGVAGACGLGPVGEAAYSLCGLLDLFLQGQGWDRRAVAVHLVAFHLLRREDDPAMTAAVLAGLRTVVEHTAARQGG